MTTELAKGKTIEEGLKLTKEDVARELGGLPAKKNDCSNLGAAALHAAIKDYLNKQS
jgi:nitrogen fixation NifU-like protein